MLTPTYLRLIDFCITQLKAQGPSRTCNESKEEEEQTPTGRATLGTDRLIVPERQVETHELSLPSTLNPTP